jgi:hypothetical protein
VFLPVRASGGTGRMRNARYCRHCRVKERRGQGDAGRSCPFGQGGRGRHARCGRCRTVQLLASSHGLRHRGLGEAVASVWLHTSQVLETVIVFRRCHVPEAQHRWGGGAVRWVRKLVMNIELTILVIRLRQQIHGYWRGLSAFSTTSVLVNVPVQLRFVRLAHLALRSLYTPDSLQMALREKYYLRNLTVKNYRGQIAGSWLYLDSPAQTLRADTHSC